MLETEKILKSNFFIVAVILLPSLEFHGTDFEKLFLLRATHVFTCLMQQELQLFCLVTVRVKVHLLET